MLLTINHRMLTLNYVLLEGILIILGLRHFILFLNVYQISFDIVVDCTGKKENYDFSLLKPWANAKYITLSPTVLDHFDNYGYDVVRGVIKTLWDLVVTKATLALRLRTLRWVFVSH